MPTFALVHGAWHGAWFWQRLAPELERRGHEAIAVELPSDDDSAAFSDYVDAVVEATAEAGDDVVVVGHSMGGLTIPLVPEARPVRQLVFVCAMIAKPGASLLEQLDREPEIFTPGFGGAPARDEQERSLWPDREETIRDLYPDCPRELAEWAAERLRPQGRPPNVEPCPLKEWPDVPAAYLLCREDGVINPAWSREAARERLGVEPIEIAGGHTAPLARPAAVAEALIAARQGA
jgi:pimeloyl-ACP methyl ester carboxylesterase